MDTTYLDRYNLQYIDSLLRQRAQISIESNAHYIIGEDSSIPNHENRIIWSTAVFDQPEAMTRAMMGAFVQDPLIYENGNEVTDSQIDQVIAPLIDFFADAVASGAIKLSTPGKL